MIDISEYGVRIRNIEASTLYEFNIGLRDHYEYKDAMLVNSLFLDFLKGHGLNVHNEDSTRDIICLEFNYGTRSYQKEVDHLRKIANKAVNEYKDAVSKQDKYLIEKAEAKREKINDLIQFAYDHKDVYQEYSKEEIRTYCYENGVKITYTSKKNKPETIHYKMLFRSTGKAKKGTCTFIRDELYDIVHNFVYMGIQLPDEDAKIVEASAYVPLISSGIVGRIKIDPHNILILDDVKRFFSRNVVSIETDENKHCFANWIDDYELSNELFDGQALIDDSIFPEWANGYVLLRHHFTKMAAFHTNMQLFFKDWCREHNVDYETYQVKDYWGNNHYLKNVQLLTTINAIKWIKFDISYEYWCKWVEANDCNFGVVKFSHPSKLGRYQKASYQITNSLDENSMMQICNDTINYINKLKNDDEAFQDFLNRNKNFSNDYDVLLALCEWNKDFTRCSYYRERKSKILTNYLISVKSGEILQNGDNLTIVGSPYAMLEYGATGNPDDCDLDTTLLPEDGTIQCYTTRFEDGEYLAGFRSPFNGRFNMSYLHNHYDDRLAKYFNFSEQIVAVNMIGTDFQDRNNGSDQDSDSMYVTNQINIVEHAAKCYKEYPTIVNNIPKDTNKYNNTMHDYAIMDNALAGSQRDIGESSNLAQIAQTYSFNFDDKKYDNYVAILSILAQASIDSAKRRFNINISEEVKIIKDDMDIKQYGYPKFWKTIRRGFDPNKINNSLHCPMNYLQELKANYSRSSKNSIDFIDFIIQEPITENKRRCRKVEELIERYSIHYYNSTMGDLIKNGEYDYSNFLLLRSDFDILIKDIRSITFSKNYKQFVIWLIKRAFRTEPALLRNKKLMLSKTNKNKSILLKVLYDCNPKLFLECFQTEI